jgi:hypothetical protein
MPLHQIVRCPVVGKRRGNKDGAVFLRPDGSGWFENFTDGIGVENFQPSKDQRKPLSSAERARVRESMRRGRIRRNLATWASCQAHRIGKLIYELNQTELMAAAELKKNPDNNQYWWALATCYRLLPRLEALHDALLSKHAGDKIEAFRHLEGV